jgi:3-methylcrotonyl-CoA carboxylase alpha subunit
VYLERYLPDPRHVEVQILADGHGHVVSLGERDCSVQRRHQKVLEEAPAPGMTEERRRAMGEAAVAAAKAVGYVGAGTVEFIANQDGSFYFMEMNTRLQVEHPVTEMITGQDLVEWQLRVAAGEALPLTQDQLRIDGHALEARIYAENPDKQFLPSTGTLRFLRTPPAVQFMRGEDAHGPAGIRIDAGVREGDTISPFYDPMIAKLIVWGKDRDEALARMRQALMAYHVVGLSTNVAFLQRLVSSQAFRTADLDTGLIERNEATLFPPAAPVGLEVIALAVAALFDREARERRIDAADQHSPWTHGGAWRLNGGVSRTLRFGYGEQVLEVTLSTNERGSTLIYADQAAPFACTCQADDIRINLGTRRAHGQVHADGETFHVFYAGRHVSLAWLDPLAHAGETESEGGKLTAPMPGKVIAVMVEAGSTVTRGTPLLVMEAMKMEHTISAPVDGVVSEVLSGVGEQVVEGAQLLAFEGKSGT